MPVFEGLGEDDIGKVCSLDEAIELIGHADDVSVFVLVFAHEASREDDTAKRRGKRSDRDSFSLLYKCIISRGYFFAILSSS